MVALASGFPAPWTRILTCRIRSTCGVRFKPPRTHCSSALGFAEERHDANTPTWRPAGRLDRMRLAVPVDEGPQPLARRSILPRWTQWTLTATEATRRTSPCARNAHGPQGNASGIPHAPFCKAEAPAEAGEIHSQRLNGAQESRGYSGLAPIPNANANADGESLGFVVQTLLLSG